MVPQQLFLQYCVVSKGTGPTSVSQKHLTCMSCMYANVLHVLIMHAMSSAGKALDAMCLHGIMSLAIAR